METEFVSTFSKGGSIETQLVSSKGQDFVSTFSKGGLMRRMVSAYEDLVQRAIMECGEMYGFDGREAIARLGLENVTIRREERKKVEKKEAVVKAAFPLPYNGENSDLCCQALRQNNGLYTQCQSHKKGANSYCKSCQQLADKSEDGIPEYGTITQRLAVSPFEYVDPKGRKPVSYTKVMKKYKVSEEQVLAEAGKLGINILPTHFEVPEDTKRGRPKKEKVEKEPKGAKGRPKKEKKVVELAGDGEDLFDTLVASAVSQPDSESDDDSIIMSAKPAKKSAQNEEAKAAKALKKQQDEEAKALKKQQEEEAKAAKALKKQQDEEARILKKQQEEEAKAARALKKQEEEAARALKKQQEEEAKAAKAAKKTTPTPAKKASESESAKASEERVKNFEFNGKKYLKSKLSGVIYDRDIFEATGEIVHIGQWNEKEQRIDFVKKEESEEEEEEYSEESSDSDSDEEEEEA